MRGCCWRAADDAGEGADRAAVLSIDPVAQAAALGISKEQLRILVGNTGLPLSLGNLELLKPEEGHRK